MGRINLTPLRVRRRALQNIQTSKVNRSAPIWLDITGDIPPAQVLLRPLPTEQPLLQIRTKTRPPKDSAVSQSRDPETDTSVEIKSKPRHTLKRKPSKMFSPIQIRYEEDSLRKRFFTDHPWELARPRVLVETSGNQQKDVDWSQGLIQPGIPLSGESVVQRQLHLLQTIPDITVSKAYDTARKEFYMLRRQEEISRRVAVEEARATGAYFGKPVSEWSMEIEDRMYDGWEAWSQAQVMENMQKNAAFEGNTMPVEQELSEEKAVSGHGGGGPPKSGSVAFGQRGVAQKGRVVVE